MISKPETQKGGDGTLPKLKLDKILGAPSIKVFNKQKTNDADAVSVLS
jgi:hypothetical protein